MKIRTFVAAVAACVLAFASCTKDNTPEFTLDGEYPSIVNKTAGKMPVSPKNVTYTIKNYKSGSLTMVFPEFPSQHSNVPSFELELKVVENNGVYTMTHEKFNIEIGGTKYICNNGVYGKIADGKFTLRYDFTAEKVLNNPDMPMVVIYSVNMTHLEGDYTGKLDAVVPDAPAKPGDKPVEKKTKGMGADEDVPQTFTIKDHKDGKCTIVLPGFKTPVDLTDCVISQNQEDKDQYTFSHEKFTIGKYVNQKGFTGTLNYATGEIHFEYDIQPGAMPMVINYTFNGKRN